MPPGYDTFETWSDDAEPDEYEGMADYHSGALWPISHQLELDFGVVLANISGLGWFASSPKPRRTRPSKVWDRGGCL